MSVSLLSPCRNWQSCDPREIATLVHAEMRAWLDELHWDVRDAWRVIEPARRSGTLPGIVTTGEGGRLTGWTAFLPLGAHLQVMAIVAPDAQTAGVLVDGILASSQSQTSASTIVCTRAGTPGLDGALRDRGFEVEHYRYMRLALPIETPVDTDLRRWRADDEQMARLCLRAYRDAPGIRAFAPDGTLAEWRHYVRTLIDGTGCGRFLPELSRVVPDPASRGLNGAIVVTDLGAGTMHVAQMAVDPGAQRQGLGRRLLQAALRDAGARFARATLLVAASNTRAMRLYEALGFRACATFIVASRGTLTPQSV